MNQLSPKYKISSKCLRSKSQTHKSMPGRRNYHLIVLKANYWEKDHGLVQPSVKRTEAAHIQITVAINSSEKGKIITRNTKKIRKIKNTKNTNDPHPGRAIVPNPRKIRDKKLRINGNQIPLEDPPLQNIIEHHMNINPNYSLPR